MTFSLIFFLSDLKRGFVKRDCLKIHLRKKSHCLMPPKYVGIIIISVTIFFLNNLIYLHSTKIIFGRVCFLEDPNFFDVSQNVSLRGMKKVKWLWIFYFLRVEHFYFEFGSEVLDYRQIFFVRQLKRYTIDSNLVYENTICWPQSI